MAMQRAVNMPRVFTHHRSCMMNPRNWQIAFTLIGNAKAVGNTAELALLIPEGARWGAAYNPDDSEETPWGTGTFTFSSCGAGHIVLEPNEVMLNNGFTRLEYDINRDILIPGIECPTPTD